MAKTVTAFYEDYATAQRAVEDLLTHDVRREDIRVLVQEALVSTIQKWDEIQDPEAWLLVTLLLSYTGYLLPWDQLSLWAVTVGTNMMGYTPVFGGSVKFVLLGSREISGETLLRWYVLHVLLLPFVIVIFMAVHFWRVRKDGGLSGPL